MIILKNMNIMKTIDLEERLEIILYELHENNLITESLTNELKNERIQIEEELRKRGVDIEQILSFRDNT